MYFYDKLIELNKDLDPREKNICIVLDVDYKKMMTDSKLNIKERINQKEVYTLDYYNVNTKTVNKVVVVDALNCKDFSTRWYAFLNLSLFEECLQSIYNENEGMFKDVFTEYKNPFYQKSVEIGRVKKELGVVLNTKDGRKLYNVDTQEFFD